MNKNKTSKIKIENKGTGAGGDNTNKNGLSYEVITDLKTDFTIIKEDKDFTIIKFNGFNTKFTRLIKKQLFKHKGNKESKIKKAHGCKEPDECYIDENKKNIFILEKKFQQCGGSVCEKLQTTDFKLNHYKKHFPEYNIVYIFCLSKWFEENCQAELEYLEEKKIPVFWGNNKNYKQQIIKFINLY